MEPLSNFPKSDAWSESTMADRFEIEDLLFRYLYALDAHDVEEFLACFTSDAEISVDYRSDVETYAGTERLREFVEGRGGNAFHATMDTAISVVGDRGTRWARFIGFPTATDGGPFPNWIGRTIDEVVRTPAGWRIQRRRIWVVQGGGSPSAVAT